MEKLEIIQCNDKKILLNYINNNSYIQLFENMDINLLKNIALNIPIVPKPKKSQTQEQTQQRKK
jgi:hypothetical protein